MAPTLNNETKMLIAFNVFEVFDIWMVHIGQETEKCQLILMCWSRNWGDSSDFKLFDIWKVIYIDLNGTGPQKNFDVSVF